MENQASQKPIFIVSINDSGQRVDNYLFKNRKLLDKSTCYKLMRKGQIRVNGKRVKPAHKLVEGDTVRIPPFVFFVAAKAIEVSAPAQQELMRCVIHEDDDYLVLNKPAGYPVHKGTGHDYGIIEVITSMSQYQEIQLAHRLDKDTSGCLLLAKNRQALLRFQEAMQQQSIIKKYLAILNGVINQAETVDAPLDTHNRINGIRHVVIKESGKPAVTKFDPLKNKHPYSLVSCQIKYGRTHQIRVHAKHLGKSVLGDQLYGISQPSLPRKLYLHAHELIYGHYHWIAPIPSEFNELVKV